MAKPLYTPRELKFTQVKANGQGSCDPTEEGCFLNYLPHDKEFWCTSCERYENNKADVLLQLSSYLTKVSKLKPGDVVTAKYFPRQPPVNFTCS